MEIKKSAASMVAWGGLMGGVSLFAVPELYQVVAADESAQIESIHECANQLGVVALEVESRPDGCHYKFDYTKTVKYEAEGNTGRITTEVTYMLPSREEFLSERMSKVISDEKISENADRVGMIMAGAFGPIGMVFGHALSRMNQYNREERLELATRVRS